MVGPGVLGLGPGLALQTGFGVLDLGAEPTGRIWGAGCRCRMHRQGLGCWVHRQSPEEEERGSDLLGGCLGGNREAEPWGQEGEGFRGGLMQVRIWG